MADLRDKRFKAVSPQDERSHVQVLRNPKHPEKISSIHFSDAYHPSHKNRRKLIFPGGSELRRTVAVMSILLGSAEITDVLTKGKHHDGKDLCKMLLEGIDPVSVYEKAGSCYLACQGPLSPYCQSFMEQGAARVYDFLLKETKLTMEERKKLQQSQVQKTTGSISSSGTVVIPKKRAFSEISSTSQDISKLVTKPEVQHKPSKITSPAISEAMAAFNVMDNQFLSM